MRRLSRLALCGCVLAAATGGCRERPEATQPRLVLLYAPCTVSKRFLSPYAPGVGWTPALDALAARGVVFRRHRTEAGLSGVAYASLLTGSQVDRHGIFTHPLPLDGGLLLLTEAFADAGFEVWFWNDHAMASPALGYAQGVPPEHVTEGRGPFGVPDPRHRHPERESFLRAEDPRFVALLERLRADPRRRALVVTNFTVTHAPYSIAWLEDLCRDDPDACADRSERLHETADLLWTHYVDLSLRFVPTVRRLGLAPREVDRLERTAELLYRANVHRLDSLFGAVLKEIESHGLLDESVISFTADHGEVLYHEGALLPWNHGFTLAPEVLDVPWLLSAPGLRPGAWEGVTRSIDVFPTLAGLAGVPVPEGAVEGVNLAPALRGEAPPPSLIAFSHTALVPRSLLRASRERGGTLLDALHPDWRGDDVWVSLRDGDRLYELTRRGEGGFEPSLFDLARDPYKQRNLYDAGDPEQRRRFEGLELRRRALAEAIDDAVARARTLPEARSRALLRQLGYIE